jgi:hypothetical protein
MWPTSVAAAFVSSPSEDALVAHAASRGAEHVLDGETLGYQVAQTACAIKACSRRLLLVAGSAARS